MPTGPSSSSRDRPPSSAPSPASAEADSETSNPADLGSAPPATEAALERLDAFARWTDEAYGIPGTRYRIGLESLVGLLPGVGDAAGLIVALYVPLEAWRLGAPWGLLARMMLWIGVDGLVGTVPVLGDVFDVALRANRRNVDLVKDWVDDEKEEMEDGEMEDRG
jgi:hypothetical protein